MSHKVLPLSIFVFLLMSALLSGHHSFCKAEDEIIEDLNQALLQTVKIKKDILVCQDTIRAYRQLEANSEGQVLLAITDKKFLSFLRHKELKQSAYISLALMGQHKQNAWKTDKGLQSDTLMLNTSNTEETVLLTGIFQPTFATLFQMSDQRLSFTFTVAALLWGLLSWTYYTKRKRHDTLTPSYGGLHYDAEEQQFYGTDEKPIHFTPMQHQLVQLLWENPSHALSKEEICQALWPKKPDANDTLYTLIRRLKPILETSTQLKMTADRGKSYRLEIK